MDKDDIPNGFSSNPNGFSSSNQRNGSGLNNKEEEGVVLPAMRLNNGAVYWGGWLFGKRHGRGK